MTSLLGVGWAGLGWAGLGRAGLVLGLQQQGIPAALCHGIHWSLVTGHRWCLGKVKSENL